MMIPMDTEFLHFLLQHSYRTRTGCAEREAQNKATYLLLIGSDEELIDP